MDLPTMTMGRSDAREAFLAYKRAVDERHDLEDTEIMRGYKFLAEGRQLMSLSQALSEAGLGKDCMPRLAVCPAEAHWCHWRPNQQGGGYFASRLNPSGRVPAVADRVDVLARTFTVPDYWSVQVTRVRAMVPITPPQFRPARGIGGLFVLWEAEWERIPRPPGDPALLKRLGEDLFAVLAVWDLTPLERAVLGARRLELPG